MPTRNAIALGVVVGLLLGLAVSRVLDRYAVIPTQLGGMRVDRWTGKVEGYLMDGRRLEPGSIPGLLPGRQ